MVGMPPPTRRIVPNGAASSALHASGEPLEMAATPYARFGLLQLERETSSSCRFHTARPAPAPTRPPSASPSRRPCRRELLLTRLLRRSPEALAAYQAPAELTPQPSVAFASACSPLRVPVVELIGGDAVVWVQAGFPAWVWDSETFQRIFPTALESEGATRSGLQMLSIFKPVVARPKAGHCFSPGEMVPAIVLPEQEKQDDAVADWRA